MFRCVSISFVVVLFVCAALEWRMERFNRLFFYQKCFNAMTKAVKVQANTEVMWCYQLVWFGMKRLGCLPSFRHTQTALCTNTATKSCGID